MPLIKQSAYNPTTEGPNAIKAMGTPATMADRKMRRGL
jgi:hypothetical protein